MTLSWEEVYVFISSTFSDMHAERDYLVKQVFPRLQEWCERRKLRLVDVDLRWGVIEADATQNKRVVQVCLERIDACRPFFLCFLGQRRGWVPARDDISPETYARYPELQSMVGGASVTEIEILHALVNPLHRGKVAGADGGVRDYAPAEQSFFYLRRPDALAELPADPPQLRRAYTNEAIADPEARRQADAELARWREAEIPATRRPVHLYSARWDPAAATPEIRLPLECPSTAPPGSPAWQAAFAAWAGLWAEAGVRVDPAGATADLGGATADLGGATADLGGATADLGGATADPGGAITDPAQWEKAEAFNARLTRGRLAGFTCDGRPLADTILADLQAAIQARFPDHVEAADLTPLQRELDQQAQFLQAAAEGFIERQGDFDALDRYLQDESNRPFFLTAPAGLGKTSLLARWIDRPRPAAPGDTLHYRFIGASDGSTTVDALLRSLLAELKDAGKLPDEQIPSDPGELRAALRGLLEAAGRRGPTVLVLDGLNQIESGLADLAWMPLALPPGLKLIASLKRGEPQAEAFLEQLRAEGRAILAELQPFAGLEDRRRLVRAYLSQYLKELDERHLETLIRSAGAGNPLYLKVVLAELRVFGAFADLGAKIRHDFGDTPLSAFGALLRRLEADPAYSPLAPAVLAPRLFGWLAHARTGLTAEEMGGLLVREGLLADDEAGRRQSADAVQGLLRQLRPYLSRREGRAGFFYESLEQAARQRVVRAERQAAAHPASRTAQEWHASLAGYFAEQPLRLGAEQKPNRRKLAELAYQCAHAGMGAHLRQTLWDYRYLAAQLESGGIEALIADYDLPNLPEAGLSAEEQRRLGLLQGALRLSAHVLSGDAAQLPSQLTGRLLGFEEAEIRALLESARRETTGPWLRPLSASLEAPGGALVRVLGAHSSMIQALSLSADGRLAVSAEQFEPTLKVWEVSSGVELCTLAGHGASVRSVALSADGRLAVSASYDQTLKVWDLEAGRELRTLFGHSGWVRAVALTPDGRLALSAAEDRTCRVWDVASGRQVRTLAGQTRGVHALALSADGRLAVSASDGAIRVWDVASGRARRTLGRRGDAAYGVALAADGRLAVSAAENGTLKIWDVAGGQLLRALAGAGAPAHFALTPDGRLALSAAAGNRLKLWDVAGGTEMQTLLGHSEPVSAVALAADGRLAISASWKTLRVWDIGGPSAARSAGGRASGAPASHAGPVTHVALRSDGRVAVSASHDGTLKGWDVPSGAEQNSLTAHTDIVSRVVLAPGGRLAVSHCRDGTLKLWELASGKELHALAGRSWAKAVAITPDGQLVVSASWDKKLKVWDLASGKVLRPLRGHAARLRQVDITPDGRLAVATTRRGSLQVLDVASGKVLQTLRGEPSEVWQMAFTPDGRRAAALQSDGALRVWDLAGGEELGRLRGAGESAPAVVLSADGRLVVLGLLRGALWIWNLETGTELRTQPGRGELVSNLELTLDGRLAVLTVRDDPALKVRDLASAAVLAAYTTDADSAGAFALAADGRCIVAGDSLGRVHFLRLEGVTLRPAIVTAWRSPAAGSAPSLAYGCPHCRHWSEAPDSALGTEIACPHCGAALRLNPFVVEADWRPVAAAWRGEE